MQKLILDEIEKIKQKYLASAEEIVGGYNREIDFSKDYEGRQIYELLQNADDAAVDSRGKVRIELLGHTLIVSNTGVPFSFSGIKSLLYPNASPKMVHSNTIGCKGLGFRAILTWANQVTIASRDFRDFTIEFSKQSAEAFYNELIGERPELVQEIRLLSSAANPVAMLSCPKILARSALIPDFSTSIIVDCKTELIDSIEKQIKRLEFEELIFLPNLEEIEIVCDGYHKLFYKVVEKNEATIEVTDLLSGDRDCASWQLYKTHGQIYDENKESSKDYEFIIAYDSEGKRTGKVLYSYFKTDVSLSFPALIHGTFELTSSRNGLLKHSNINRQLVTILADFLVETAIAISEKHAECNYNPLRMVISTGIDHALAEEYHLDSLLKEKAKDKRILPTIAGNYISIADQPKYTSIRFERVLSTAFFQELMPVTKEKKIEEYIQSYLGIEFYSYDHFCQKINESIADYSLEQKATLIGLIEKQYKGTTSKDRFPHLLEDSAERIIDTPVTVYPLPNEEKEIDLPKWARIRFLSPKMESAICNQMEIENNRRSLVKKFSRYHLEEYGFDRLLRDIIGQATMTTDLVEKSKGVLDWLWKHYKLNKAQDINNIRIRVLCRDGELHYAHECYLGKEFGNELGERLISIFSSNFVDLACFDQDDITPDIAVRFLEWIGVSRYPRFVYKTLTENERMQYINSFNKLYVKSERIAYTYAELNPNYTYVGCYEHLEELIEKANFNDLLSWFVIDNSVKSRLSSETEEKNPESCISGTPVGKRSKRIIEPTDMKSYLRWVLGNKEWIPNEEGIKRCPNHCCFDDDKLSPLIIVPHVDYSYIKTLLGRNYKKDIELLLCWLGVADNFQEMDKRVIYDVLFSLQDLDQGYSKGKRLYRKLIRDGLAPGEYASDNPSYDRFIEKGTVLVRNGDTKKYVPVSDAYYADKKVFSKSILQGMNMFEADGRSGEEKIKKLFGVKPLKYTFAETDGAPMVHPLNEEFMKEYSRFVPFIYACRSDKKTARSDYLKLASTRIELCSLVRIKYSFGKETTSSTLGKYEIAYLRKNNTERSIVYIQVPGDSLSFPELKRNYDFAEAVAEAITVILDVNEDKAFYCDLFRDDMSVREKKMRADRGDENLEALTEARKLFHAELNFEALFWRALAEATRTDLPEDADIATIIRTLGIDSSNASKIQYDNLSNPNAIPSLLAIFDALDVDIPEFNRYSTTKIDLLDFNKKIFNEKRSQYKKKYEAYLYELLKDDPNNAEEYYEKCEHYDIAEPVYSHICVDDVNAMFETLFGVDFSTLDKYSELEIKTILEEKLQATNKLDIDNLEKTIPQPRIEAYALFGQLSKLLIKPDSAEKEPSRKQTNEEPAVDATKILKEKPVGFSYVKTEAQKPGKRTQPSNNSTHKKQSHTEKMDKAKQTIGYVGELVVFRELRNLYPSLRWISGNAEKAGSVKNGDDTCGYDMVYTDENGVTQYVEVKASRDDSIVFYLSESEFQFARNHAGVYEIIYVHIGDDSKLKGKPERLGHLFVLSDGETLFENKRFTLESNSYTITAKGLPINE